MQYDIEAGGHLHRVTVERVGDGFAVNVDGRVHEVDAVRVDPYTLSLIVDKAWLHDTVIVREGTAGLVVRVGAVPVPVTVNGRRRFGAELEAGRAPNAQGSLRVVAPMPGKVVAVLVVVGDHVRANQPVVVVEAMKMENEVRASRDGTVTEIHAPAGTSVDAGTLLVVMR